jgi:ankyrin repeat protein
MCSSFECYKQAVEALLKRGVNPNSKDSGSFSDSPLLLASGRNGLGVDTMKLLVKYGADLSPTFHKLGWTPLIKACDTGNDKEVEFLLFIGAKPNVKDSSQHTPLRYAIHHVRREKRADASRCWCRSRSYI